MVPRPYSGTAITAFVSALCFFCPGIHVLVSVICSLIALGATSGGKARGRGLALVAIPIALLLGAGEGYLGYRMADFTMRVIQAPLAAGNIFKSSETLDAKADEFYEQWASDDLKATITQAQFRLWAHKVVEKHGTATVVDMSGFQNQRPAPVTGATARVPMELRVTFVNGDAIVAADLVPVEEAGRILPVFKVDEVAVDGLSARSFAGGS